MVVYHDPILHDIDLSGFDDSVFTKQNKNGAFKNIINGKVYPEGMGWFVKDFTLSELKGLKHRMRYRANQTHKFDGEETGNRPEYFDGQFNMVGIDDVIEYMMEMNSKFPQVNKIGLNIELKSV